MIHILLEGYRADAPWLYETLKRYLLPTHRVAVIAFSFRDSRVRGIEDWNKTYGKGGSVYGGIVKGLRAYGIRKEQITFVNYFTDTRESATEKIASADILYFPGGLPDKTMERLREFGLEEVLCRHDGIVMGYSAGALVQLSEYHLSPDHDYPEFRYEKGLPYLHSFYVEVHYQGTEAQDAAIQRVLRERSEPVYAISLMQGAILVENETVTRLGDVKRFTKENEE